MSMFYDDMQYIVQKKPLHSLFVRDRSYSCSREQRKMFNFFPLQNFVFGKNGSSNFRSWLKICRVSNSQFYHILFIIKRLAEVYSMSFYENDPKILFTQYRSVIFLIIKEIISRLLILIGEIGRMKMLKLLPSRNLLQSRKRKEIFRKLFKIARWVDMEWI